MNMVVLCLISLSIIYGFIFFDVSQIAYAKTLRSCDCIAFRLDDIQDYYLNNAQIAIMDLLERKNASFTLGIIGDRIGNDTRLIYNIIDTMNGSNSNENFRIEIANHGWNHENFSSLNKEDQALLIKAANEKIYSVLGVVPSVFIPPSSLFNNETLSALRENGIYLISANLKNDPPPYSFDINTTIYHIPVTAATGDVKPDSSNWISYTHEDVFSQIRRSLDEYGFVVVNVHPQDHSLRKGSDIFNEIDREQINELNLLIDEIRREGLMIVTISEIKQKMS